MATVATKSLAVNAAFLQEIKDDHHEIRDLLRSSRELVADQRVSIESLVKLLHRLRDQLSFHFALEEAYGYYDADLADSAPWLCDKATRLRQEHTELFLAMGDCVNQGEKLLYHESSSKNLSQVCEQVLMFCDRFEDHERRETELVLEALDDDVGVGD